eukprot:gene7940-10031_t
MDTEDEQPFKKSTTMVSLDDKIHSVMSDTCGHTLFLRSTEVSDAGALAFVDAIKQNETLVNFELAENPKISPSVANEILKLLGHRYHDKLKQQNKIEASKDISFSYPLNHVPNQQQEKLDHAHAQQGTEYLNRVSEGAAYDKSGIRGSPAPVLQTESHYDRHGSAFETDEQRKKSKTFQLRTFHNAVKARLISRLSYRGSSHLDIACGRGSDIRKWNMAQIRSVVGIDLSSESIKEAKMRYELISKEQHRWRCRCEFFQTPDLGRAPIEWTRQYPTVSSMFAANYLFESEEAVNMFMQNVSSALQDGGRFYGTFTSAQAIISLLNNKMDYSSNILRIKRLWDGEYNAFGSPYTFALLHTVTNDNLIGDDLGDGCPEYLAFFSIFAKAAAKFGLFPDEDIIWKSFRPVLRSDRWRHVFEADPPHGKQHGFRYFAPVYSADPDGRELHKASKLYAAFIFKKDLSQLPESTRKLVAEPASGPHTQRLRDISDEG